MTADEIKRRILRPALSTKKMDEQVARNWTIPTMIVDKLLSSVEPALSKILAV